MPLSAVKQTADNAPNVPSSLLRLRKPQCPYTYVISGHRAQGRLQSHLPRCSRSACPGSVEERCLPSPAQYRNPHGLMRVWRVLHASRASGSHHGTSSLPTGCPPRKSARREPDARANDVAVSGKWGGRRNQCCPVSLPTHHPRRLNKHLLFVSCACRVGLLSSLQAILRAPITCYLHPPPTRTLYQPWHHRRLTQACPSSSACSGWLRHCSESVR